MTISILLSALLTSLTVTTSAMQAVPNLAGSWKMDADKSSAVGGGRGRGEAAGGGRGGGLGLGPAPDQLTITQNATTMTIVERRGDADSTVILRLDGQPEARTFSAGRSAGATAASVTSIKDVRLTTLVTLPAAPGGGEAARYEETRYVDKDGALIVEITMAAGVNSRRVVYTRMR